MHDGKYKSIMAILSELLVFVFSSRVQGRGDAGLTPHAASDARGWPRPAQPGGGRREAPRADGRSHGARVPSSRRAERSEGEDAGFFPQGKNDDGSCRKPRVAPRRPAPGVADSVAGNPIFHRALRFPGFSIFRAVFRRPAAASAARSGSSARCAYLAVVLGSEWPSPENSAQVGGSGIEL
jgi:hypothetical protein